VEATGGVVVGFAVVAGGLVVGVEEPTKFAP
jgi:hypothetical protein